jgi:hypothetical protein
MERLPDPEPIRQRGILALQRFGLPVPPRAFPALWSWGDPAQLRQRDEIESRLAVISVVLARCFGMPQDAAMAWLLESHLLDRVTTSEWRFILGRSGDHRVFPLHNEAALVLAWTLGLAIDLDPTRPAGSGLLAKLPNLPAGESYPRWRARALAVPRKPVEVAVYLDLYTLLEWSVLEARQLRQPVREWMDPNTFGQRRLTLEWVLALPDQVN